MLNWNKQSLMHKTRSLLDQQIELKQKQVEVLDRSISTSNALFVSGRANYLEIINAQQSFLDSQLELLDLQQQKQALNIHLYRALGGGL
jgi:multidrug efflux system outer membrane protein